MATFWGGGPTVSVILNNVMSSATEAELAGLFHNAKDAAPLRVALEKWDASNPPLLSKLTTPALPASPTGPPANASPSHGHALLLDKRSCPPRPLHLVLASWLRKPRRLLCQAPSHDPSLPDSPHLPPSRPTLASCSLCQLSALF